MGKRNMLAWAHKCRQTALSFESVIRVMAFQDFAQKAFKIDMQFLTLYCLIRILLGVHVLLYHVNCIFVYGWSFLEVALYYYLKLCFSSFERKKIFSVLFNVPKVLWFELLFLPPLLRGTFDFFVVRFFVFVFFFGHAVSEACRELSDLSGSCSVGKLFLGSRGWVEVWGTRVYMALSFSVYCTFWVLIALQSLLSFQTSFRLKYSNIPYIITVFSFQCNAFKALHPPTWRQAQVKVRTIREN